MIRVVVVGGGNLAESVAVALSRASGVDLVQIYLRDRVRGEELTALTGAPHATFDEELAAGDIYLLAVSDGAIAELSAQLNFAPNAVVAHTAGSSSIELIDPSLRAAVLYPMQTFTRGRRVDFSIIPTFVEGRDKATLQQIKQLAELISGSVVELDSASRLRLHLSAVFVCNFVNAMFIAGEELVRESGLSFEVLKPLIEECCAKACSAASPSEVQTGPAARGDFATVERHRAMLSQSGELGEIYQNVSKYIWETLKRI